MNFSYLQADGFDRVEFQRGPNSALYGSDALASVISITTQRGNTPLPLFSYAADGGTFGTYHQDGSVGGYWKRLDYFTDYSGYGTQNSVPNSQYHRDVYLGNLGWQITPSTTLRATVDRAVAGFNSANAIAAYGIADDAANDQYNTSFGATLNNQANDRWHNLLRYGGVRLRSQFNDYAPTGIPYDAYGLGFPSYYLGAPGHLSVCRPVSAGFVISDEHELRIRANGLPGKRKADRALRLPLYQREWFHLQPVHGHLVNGPQQFQLHDGDSRRPVEPAVLYTWRRD
jgi:outer membrane receptor protein involved in Fe transport